MEADDIFPNIWADGIEVLDEYFIPNLLALQGVFSRAAQFQQHVLVFFT